MIKNILILFLLNFIYVDAQEYYLDLKSNIDDTGWGTTNSVSVIQNMFNYGRNLENQQLKTVSGFVSVPGITMPTQQNWDLMSEKEQLFYLLNQERKDRGLKELELLFQPLSEISQYYSSLLLTNNLFGHTSDGKTSYQRMSSVAGYNTSNIDYCPYSENLAVFMVSNQYPWYAVPAAVYGWNYEDAGSNWGHRRANFYKNFVDNYGSNGKEGFLGVGISKGPYTSTRSGITFNFSTMIVMNFFDPKASFQTTTSIKSKTNEEINVRISCSNQLITFYNFEIKNIKLIIFDLLGNQLVSKNINAETSFEFYTLNPILFYEISDEKSVIKRGKIGNF